tara:strand:+ start:5758 stop:6753 length:996 start_codon:yes stop_codon:yes gene_type:complete
MANGPFLGVPSQKEIDANIQQGSQFALDSVRSFDAETDEPYVAPNPFIDQNTTVPEYNADEAYEILESLLNQYNLPLSLVDQIKEWVALDLSVQQMKIRLRGTDEYKDRFAGMALRRENGLNQVSEDRYLELESNYASVLAEFGLPESFYDSPEDFASFIGNDVSPEEFATRTALAAQAVSEIDPNLDEELRRLYPEIDDGDLISYFLDPDRAVPLMELKLQMSAAGLSSTAKSTLGEGFSTGVAEQLARQPDVQPVSVRALASSAGLTQSTLRSEGVSVDTLASSTFGLDADDATLVRRIRDRRQQTQQAGAGGLLQQTGASGLGAAQMA